MPPRPSSRSMRQAPIRMPGARLAGRCRRRVRIAAAGTGGGLHPDTGRSIVSVVAVGMRGPLCNRRTGAALRKDLRNSWHRLDAGARARATVALTHVRRKLAGSDGGAHHLMWLNFAVTADATSGVKVHIGPWPEQTNEVHPVNSSSGLIATAW